MFGPIGVLEENIRIQPTDFVALGWQTVQSDVEELLFLPKDISPADLDEKVRIRLFEFKGSILKGQFHHAEWYL